jgi:hypothetical protein
MPADDQSLGHLIQLNPIRKKTMKSIYLKGMALLVLAIAQNSHAESAEQYQEALRDASFVEDKDLTNQLLAVTPETPGLVWNEDKTRLLVVTWKSNSSYNDYIKNVTKSSNNPNYALWVTAAPQVQAFCRRYLADNPTANADQLSLRLKQYLGLPPVGNYDVFVEMWIKPEDIFRPCVDPEINDSQCNKAPPAAFPVVANIPNYGAFYQNLYFTRFRSSNPYPWTGIGYTYDWGGGENKVGASEFILVPEASYEVKQAVTTLDYCK